MRSAVVLDAVVVETDVVTLDELVEVVLVEVTVVTFRGRCGFVRTVVHTRRWWRRWQTRFGFLAVCASPRLAATSGEAASAPAASATTSRLK